MAKDKSQMDTYMYYYHTYTRTHIHTLHIQMSMHAYLLFCSGSDLHIDLVRGRGATPVDQTMRP